MTMQICELQQFVCVTCRFYKKSVPDAYGSITNNSRNYLCFSLLVSRLVFILPHLLQLFLHRTDNVLHLLYSLKHLCFTVKNKCDFYVFFVPNWHLRFFLHMCLFFKGWHSETGWETQAGFHTLWCEHSVLLVLAFLLKVKCGIYSL